MAKEIVSVARKREDDDAIVGAELLSKRKSDPARHAHELLQRSVSSPGLRDPRIDPKQYTTGETLVGALARHYGDEQSELIANEVNLFGQLVVGA